MAEGLEISTRAYCKMMMHAAKYPSSNLNGVLLARADEHNRVCDTIPLFHLTVGLTPMLEVALSQIESEAGDSGLVVAGLYHAHDNITDNHVDVFTQKIADKIAENRPKALLVTIDSKRLSSNIESTGLIVRRFCEGKWSSGQQVRLEHETTTLACASALVQKRIFRDIVDFDNHLDDISQDYLNVGLNMKIDSCL